MAKLIQEEATKLLYPVDLTGITGRPISGKTTLLKILRKATVFTGMKVICADNSEDVRKWHLAPENMSPFRDMCLNHAEHIKNGWLIPDEEVNMLVMSYIRAMQEKAMRKFDDTYRIGTFIISGWPRTHIQIEFGKESFTNFRIGVVHISEQESNELRLKRIAEMGDSARPDDLDERTFWSRQRNFSLFTQPAFEHELKENPTGAINIKFQKPPEKKAELLVIRGVNCCPRTQISMRNQINPRPPANPGVLRPPTPAQIFIDSIVRQTKQ